MKCSVCGGDVWVGSSTGTCSDCLKMIIANAVHDDEPNEPQDEDLVTKDYITFFRANMGGRVAFRVPKDADWRLSAEMYMDRENYWPDIWLEEERGGYINITVEGP